jgi:protein-S-isoprenylcysteine O-methyltransferase Ste14
LSNRIAIDVIESANLPEEEAEMLFQFGKEYARYAARRPRFIPHLGKPQAAG